jgi:hypothetical protein
VSANWIALFNLSLQVSLSWNAAALSDLSQWRIGGIFSLVPGTGVSTGIGASAGGLLTYSGANCPEQFRGLSGTFGGSAGVGVVVGGDLGNVNFGSPKTYNLFCGVGLEVSPEFFSLSFEGHAGAGWTAAGSFGL